MAQVVLIPTGRMEHAALGPALKQLFPTHDFLPRPKETHLNGFTSRDVAPLVAVPPGPVPSELENLAAELVNAIVSGRHSEGADFAYVVEDLELVNDKQPQLVAQLFRDAVDMYVRDNWSSMATRTRIYNVVRERCSFHLFRPMTETYFFGEPDALTRAGASAAAQLPNGLDLEEFRTNDQSFLQLTPNQRPKNQRRIIDMPDRERHPKSYLHYLCDPTLKDKRQRYRETQGGVNALGSLDWQQVLASPPHCPFLHAFLDDLSFALNQQLPFVNRTNTCTHTRYPGGNNRLLRNL